MTRELFVQFVDYFVKRMEEAGYGRKHKRCMILLLDGHTSRWTHHGLQQLILHGFFPFCIGSHTSAWAQPNDDGVNGQQKAILGRCIHEWRALRPFGIFDRSAYNECLAKAVHLQKVRLAAELAAYKARVRAWKKSGSNFEDQPVPALVTKSGNVITRAWERTGWFPLKRDSINWQKVIPSLGSRYSKGEQPVEQPMLAVASTSSVEIREMAWEGYKANFLAMAAELKAASDARKKRRHTSVVDTRTGMGFTCADDIDFLRVAEEEKRKADEEKAKRKLALQAKRDAVNKERERVLKEARDILEKNPTAPQANPLLKRGHLVQLLTSMGHKESMFEADGPRKGKLLLIKDLRTLFWTHHDTTTPPSPVSDPPPSPVSEATVCESDDDSDRNSESVPFTVNTKVKVFWPGVSFWYEGVVTKVDQSNSTFQVHYKHDDAYEWHDLTWEVKVLE